MDRRLLPLVAALSVACTQTAVVVDAAPRGDAGPQFDTTGCAPYTEPAPAPGRPCSAATRTCLERATTDAAQSACFAADTNAMACEACVRADVLASCTAPGVCAQADGNLRCCIATLCPTADPSCVEAVQSVMGGTCYDVTRAYPACIEREQDARRCGISREVCFPSEDAGP